MSSPYFLQLFSEILEKPRFNSEVTSAKEEFQKIAGQIMESDRSYNARINAFHNWYILDRPLHSVNQTPHRYYIEYNRNTLEETAVKGLGELADNIHAVFQLLKLKKDVFMVRDLASGKKYAVQDAVQVATMEHGEVFNSRLFVHDGKYFLTNYVIVHPPEVAKIIRAEAKRVRKKKEDSKSFLFRLLFFHSRWEQYSQWDVRNIYRFDGGEGVGSAVPL